MNDEHTGARIERDTFGEIEVPDDALWGAQTQRSLHHFAISTERMAPELIRALAMVKRSAALVNRELGVLDAKKADAIVRAADEVLAGQHDTQFPLSVWQTGSGTQTNMNMNEVLANRASEILGGVRGEERLVHPNDDVNRSQSSNDVFPTAMNVAAVGRDRSIETAARRWRSAARDASPRRPKAFSRHRQDRPHAPAGRHAADARPGVLGLRRACSITESQARAKRRFAHLGELALGGTAVGTGLNAHAEGLRARRVAAELVALRPGCRWSNRHPTSSRRWPPHDAIVHRARGAEDTSRPALFEDRERRALAGERSALWTRRAVDPPRTNRARSIMPGKVNPTQCEALTMASRRRCSATTRRSTSVARPATSS